MFHVALCYIVNCYIALRSSTILCLHLRSVYYTTPHPGVNMQLTPRHCSHATTTQTCAYHHSVIDDHTTTLPKGCTLWYSSNCSQPYHPCSNLVSRNTITSVTLYIHSYLYFPRIHVSESTVSATFHLYHRASV